MVARNPAAVAAERLARADIPGLAVGVAGMRPAGCRQKQRGEEGGPVQAFAHGQSAAQVVGVSGPSQRPSPQQRAARHSGAAGGVTRYRTAVALLRAATVQYEEQQPQRPPAT